MPGLVGYVRHESQASPTFNLEAMGRLLEGDGRFKRHLYEGDGYGLGRVSLDILNPQAQPIWNRERSRCVVMEGELYDQQRPKAGAGTERGAVSDRERRRAGLVPV